MKHIATVLVAFSVILLAATGSATSQSIEVTRNLTSMPLAFTENQGQWDEQVLYRANAGGATMWFTKDGAVYQFTRTIKSEDDDQVSIVDERYGMMPDDMKDRQPDSIESIAIKASLNEYSMTSAIEALIADSLDEYSLTTANRALIGDSLTEVWADLVLFDTSYIYLNVDSILQVDTILISGDYIINFSGDHLSVTAGVLNVTIPAQGDSAYWDAIADQVAADSMTWNSSVIDELEVYDDLTIHGNLVREQHKFDLDMLNIKCVQPDTCLDIVVPKTAWMRNEIIKITPISVPAFDTLYDSVRVGSIFYNIKLYRALGEPSSIAAICDSMVARINGLAVVQDNMTAYDSTTFYIIVSDSNHKSIDVRCGEYQTVDTISANDMYMTIHPSTIYDPLGVTDSNWTHVMGATPYTSAGYENPIIRVSHDNAKWDLPIIGTDTCPDPIFTNLACTSYTHATACGDVYGYDVAHGVAHHLSDAHLVHWTDGNFYYYVRASFAYDAVDCGNENEDAIFVSMSTDLVNWAAPTLVAGPDSMTNFISPSSELYKHDTLYFWAVHQGEIDHDSTNRLMLYKAEHPESTWVFMDTCIVYPYRGGGELDSADTVWSRTHGIWHPEVRKWGADQFYMLTADQGQGLFIGLSGDGLNWDVRREPLLGDYTDLEGNLHYLYKASSMIIHKGNQVGLGIWYSNYASDGSSPVNWWATSYTETFFNDTLETVVIDFDQVFYSNNSADSCIAFDYLLAPAENQVPLLWLDSGFKVGSSIIDTVFVEATVPCDMFLDSLYFTCRMTGTPLPSISYILGYVDAYTLNPDSVVNSPTTTWWWVADPALGRTGYGRFRLDLENDINHLSVPPIDGRDSLFVYAGQKLLLEFRCTMGSGNGSVRMQSTQIIGTKAWRGEPWWNNKEGYGE